MLVEYCILMSHADKSSFVWFLRLIEIVVCLKYLQYITIPIEDGTFEIQGERNA